MKKRKLHRNSDERFLLIGLYKCYRMHCKKDTKTVKHYRSERIKASMNDRKMNILQQNIVRQPDSSGRQ